MIGTICGPTRFIRRFIFELENTYFTDREGLSPGHTRPASIKKLSQQKTDDRNLGQIVRKKIENADSHREPVHKIN